MYNVAALVISKWTKGKSIKFEKELNTSQTSSFLDIISDENVLIKMEKEWKENVQDYWSEILNDGNENSKGMEYNMDELDTKNDSENAPKQYGNYKEKTEPKHTQEPNTIDAPTPDGEFEENKYDINDLSDMIQFYNQAASKQNTEIKQKNAPLPHASWKDKYDFNGVTNMNIILNMFHHWLTDEWSMVGYSSLCNKIAPKTVLTHKRDIKSQKNLEGPEITSQERKINNNYNK